MQARNVTFCKHHIIWMMALAKKEGSIYDLRRSDKVNPWRAFAARFRTKARKNCVNRHRRLERAADHEALALRSE
jgi:hypothetical protein